MSTNWLSIERNFLFCLKVKSYREKLEIYFFLYFYRGISKRIQMFQKFVLLGVYIDIYLELVLFGLLLLEEEEWEEFGFKGGEVLEVR